MRFPETEAELRDWVAGGELRETHSVELKQEAGLDRASRSEIARDLASLALDGGTMIVGIAEDKQSGSFFLHPVLLAGRVEALDQIADLRIEPSLSISVSEILSETDPKSGYLVVTVHASPVAPHMVDGVYYGRGEKRRRRLSDAEVVRLHRSRRDDGSTVLASIEEDLQRDPFPENRGSTNAHLFLVAIPVTASPSIGADLAWDRSRLTSLVKKAEVGLHRSLTGVSPAPLEAYRLITSEHGLGTTSISDDQPYESGAIQIEFREDGSIHLFAGRLTDEVPFWGKQIAVVFDVLAVANVTRLLRWAISVGEETGYTGAWDLAIAGTRLKDGRSFALLNRGEHFESIQGYPAPRYIEHTRATRAELQSAPQKVAGRLLGRFLRALKSSEQFSEHVGDSAH